MSTEPLTTTPAAGTAGSETGLMVTMLLMVLLGVVGMLVLSA
jgi:hypothetical protein